MKNMIPLIMMLSLIEFVAGQHISDFEGLSPDVQDTDFHIPASHTFQFIIEEGDPLIGGGNLPGQCDFAGYVARQNSSKFGVLSVNSEDVPGGVTLLDIEFDDVLGMWIIKDSNAVNFDFNIVAEDLRPDLVGSTLANCSGTVTPWNTIISCEEYTLDEVLSRYPWAPPTFFKVDGESDGYDVYGWAIEIDPLTKEVINQDGGRNDQDKLWAMGNFKHENAVVHENRRTVYQGADATNGEGYLFKFVADEAENLSSGDLYVYKGDKKTNHSWIQIANKTIADQNSTREQCAAVGATDFGGIEDVEISPIDGMIYFAVKRESTDEFSNLGVVYRFKDTDALDGSGLEDFEIYAGNQSYEVLPGVFVPWGQGNDNLVFDSLGNLWVAQDGGNDYIWVIYKGHSQQDPNVKIFGRTPSGSEPTGLTFSPDERYIFMSIQHPSASNNVTSQKDALNRDVFFDNDVVIVLAREEHLGTDQTQTEQQLMISQYFNDTETNSKWLELINISDDPIAEGSLFLNLYENGSPDEVLSVAPKAVEQVPELMPGEVLLLKNSPNPSLPLTQNLGPADQILSSVADFDENDVILITSTPGDYGYNNRRDILGNTQAQPWGAGQTMLRGANSLEQPEREFDVSNWIVLDSLDEVSSASKTTNLALGTQKKGKTVWNGTDWTLLEPDRSRAVEIQSDLMVGQSDFHAYDLMVASDAKMTFEEPSEGSNQNLMIYGDLNIEGELIVGDTESLIIKSANATVTGNMVKKEQSMPHNDIYDITYWSPPVSGANVEATFINVDPNRIYFFDQSRDETGDPESDTYWDAWVNATGSMLPGRGYAAQGPDGQLGVHQIEFEGMPNFGSIVYSEMVFHNDNGSNENEQNDYNLVGNPYPASLDIESFIEGNPAIDGTVYFWTHATPFGNGSYSESDYVVYNNLGGVAAEDEVEVSRNIGSGQGFFVRAVEEGDLTFDSSWILPGENDQFFKTQSARTQPRNRIWLNLEDDQGSFEQILVGFTEKSTLDMDRGYDAFYLEGGNRISFYSFLNTRRLVIQGLPEFTGLEQIRLGISVNKEVESLILSIDRSEGELRDATIILEDMEMGILHDLTKENYAFSVSDETDLNSRFIIKFQESALSLDEDSEMSEFKIFQQGSDLVVQSEQDVTNLEIFDVLGRPLKVDPKKSDSNTFNLENIPRGSIFLVRLQLENGHVIARRLHMK